MFTFAWPLAFCLFPLYWLLRRWLPHQKEAQPLLMVPFLERIKALAVPQSASTSVFTSRAKALGCFLTWTLLIIACANPQWLGPPISVQQSGRNIMLAVDLSPSMEIPDLERNNQTINRLQTVKAVASPFIEKRQGDKLGLILFGSKAYLQTPLTFDRKTVNTMLGDASIGLAGERTAIGDAVGLAVKKLSEEDVKSRILILLTDGGNNTGVIDPLAATAFAKEQNIKIYTVGIGASQMLVQGIFGSQLINPSKDLDENLLKKIAEQTDGAYFRAEDEKALSNILDAINQLEPVTSESHMVRPITTLFYWPLLIALLLIGLLIFPKYTIRRL